MRASVEDMLDFKLTEAQKKLVAENTKVIGSVYHRFLGAHSTAISYDEIYGDAAIGLCRAAKIFDEELHNEGEFFPFAYSFVKWAVFNSITKRDRYYHRTTSMNKVISQNDNGDGVELGSIIAGPDEWEPLEYKILVESVYQKVECVLTDSEKEILRPWLNGVGYKEIAKKFRIAPMTVESRKRSVQKKCRAAFNAEEFFA